MANPYQNYSGAPGYNPNPAYAQPGQQPPQQPPPHGAPPQGYYPPPQGYPPQGYPPQGYPPQGQYPPPGQYPPQGQYPPPQQPGYGYPAQPPPGGYNIPLGAPGYGAPGQFPQPGYGAPVAPTPPSLGYIPGQMATGRDATKDAEALRKAMKGFGTDETTLIDILSRADPLYMALINDTYTKKIKRNLEQDIAKECSGKLEKVLLALVRGPLMQDVYAVNEAIKGMGTNESLLDNVLLGRTNADIKAIKEAYKKTFGSSLEADVRGDLSAATEQFYNNVMAAERAEEATPIDPNLIDQDVKSLHGALRGNLGVPKSVVFQMLARRSDAQLRAISDAYKAQNGTDLEADISELFDGHMKDALVQILRGARNPARKDAQLLEESMAGFGTKDELLIYMAVRVHWNRDHMEKVKDAYRNKYGKELRSRVAGETKGDYEKALLAVLQ
ncbi:hypothetical protein D8B26_000267 [Coccidioides posadasii str. Silveira]|uniref:Annexin n=1 Tax=Coccidioides posadasii (strain RMSCC 757 / Silveira) TaxID=443226 RepID=E9D857_COCPS|nr:annexin [Coccidioides posadasii str. Silveira]QVM05561.1 hypothetical protein D8B26_000267 [Coccidioides posadasii str. Silveira]